MKILILGGNGMLGHRLWAGLSLNHDVIATIRKGSEELILKSQIPGLDINRAIYLNDVLNESELQEIITKTKPNYVINCIGIIKQIEESKNHILSLRINALLPHILNQLAEKMNFKLIHFSTDCVFDGKRGKYLESDISNAEDLYGRTKFLGEVAYSPNTLTIRTSIIGRELNPKGSLIDWFLSQTGDVYGYKNALYSGFPTHTFVKIIEQYIFPFHDLYGVYQVSSEPINKFELLQLVKKIFNKKINILENDTFKIDRTLSSEKFRQKTGFKPLPWVELVQDLLIDKELYLNK